MTRPSSRGDGAGVVRVVPEVGPGHLGLELGPAGLELVPAQVALGLGQPVPQRLELGGEVAGFGCAGPQAASGGAMAELELLAAAAPAGLVAADLLGACP